MERKSNYILHTFRNVSPLLEADKIRREIQTLLLQFQGPPPLKCLNETQFMSTGACFALQFFYPPVPSVSYENHHKTSSVLSASKTGYSIVPQYNKSFTPFHTGDRVFWLHLGLFVCFSFVGVFYWKSLPAS